MDLSAEQQNALDRALYIHGSGNLGDAERLYKELLDGDPEQADALHYLGVIRLQTNRVEDAVKLIRRAIDARPGYIDAMVNLGFGLNALGRFDEAVIQFEKVLGEGNVTAPVLANLGGALAHLGRYAEAVSRFEEALKIQPELAEVRRGLADILHRTGRLAESIEHYEKLVHADPGNADGHYRLGVIYRDLGKKDMALASFRTAVEKDESHAKAWHAIASASTMTDDDINSVLALKQRRGASDDDRMRLAFALGRQFENAGRANDASAQFVEANGLRREQQEYDIGNDLLAMSNLQRRFDKSFIEKWSAAGLPDRTPIFVVGMPRSGTTLIEQILASHPDVFGAGELQLLVHAIVETFPISNGIDYTSSIAGATKESIQAVARRYLDGLPRQKAERIVDKLPHNFLNVGMIRILFPDAAIVHCRRDARDTCFSIYKHLFGSNSHVYAYDLEELGRYYKAYASLMKHWEQVMPGHMHEVHYESMIEDQEQTTRDLLDACGLEWNPACLDFHEFERPVATLSASQVRQPIYGGSIGSWKPYEAMLAPLLDFLDSG